MSIYNPAFLAVKAAVFSKDQLKAYYKFNETSGNILNKATDVGSTHSFTSEDLVVTGATYSAAGKIGNSLSFDGVNDKAVGAAVANWKLLSNANTFTFSIWIKYTGTWINDNVWLSSCNADPNQGMIFDARDTGDVRFVSLRAGVADFNDFWNTNISDANWHHYVIRYDHAATQIELWLDGVNQGTKTCTLVGTGNSDEVLQLMDTTYGGAADGNVDEFSVWARKLTDAEIGQLYNAGAGLEL